MGRLDLDEMIPESFGVLEFRAMKTAIEHDMARMEFNARVQTGKPMVIGNFSSTLMNT